VDDRRRARPLRVTAVLPYGTYGGAERWLTRLLPATDRLAVDAVVLGEGPLATRLARLGVPAVVRPVGRRPWDLLGPARWLAARLAADPPDLLLCTGVKAELVGLGATWLAGGRTVWVRHDHSFDGLLARALGRLADGVVASSAELAAATGRHDALVLPPPLPAGPALGREPARAALADRGLALDGRPTAAAVGRLVPYKGYDDAVRALASPGGADWQLIVAGGPDPAAPGEADRLVRLAVELGVADRLRLAGELPDAGRYLAAFDAVLSLTRPEPGSPGPEGFGLAALEAMAAGVPVVVTSPGPAADRAAAGAGLVVPPGEPAAVAGALALLGDLRRRAELGRTAARLAGDHPSAAASATRLVGYLAAVAARPGAGLAGGPPVSVIATVRDERPAVGALLATIRLQLDVPGDEFVVVDGGSTDGTAELVAATARDDPRVRLLSRPGAGISAGRNAAVRAAANEWVAGTDAGCRPDGGWLAAFRAAAAEPTPPDLLTGGYRVTGGPRPAALARALALVGYPELTDLRRPTVLARCYAAAFGRAARADAPTGRSVAFTRSAWRAAGGFREDLATAEDVLFGRAVVAAGRRAGCAADATVEWEQRGSLGETARMYFRYGFGGARAADRGLLGRDLARMAGYLAGGLLLSYGRRRGRAAAALAVAGYLSLPLARAARGPQPLATAALVPVAAVVRDLAKAAGAVAGAAAGMTARAAVGRAGAVAAGQGGGRHGR